MPWLAAALGGALGTIARHWVNIEIAHRYERSVPYATATVNLVGAAIIGLLAGAVASERLVMSPTVRTFVFVGILGGFTTFSSFMLDNFTLANGGQAGVAAANLFGQNLIGFALVWAGYHAAIALL